MAHEGLRGTSRRVVGGPPQPPKPPRKGEKWGGAGRHGGENVGNQNGPERGGQPTASSALPNV
eukprot:605636-Lingulodinium_polyedra.AAC.1